MSEVWMNAPQLFTFRSKLGSHALADHYRVDIDTGFGRVPLSVRLLSARWMDRPDLFSRLEDAARVLDVLSHPHIIQSAGMTRFQGRPALVTEYTPGRSLERLVQQCARSGRTIPLPLIVSIGASVASAMHHAYATLDRVHTNLSAGGLVLHPDGHVIVTRFEGSTVRRRRPQPADGMVGALDHQAPVQRTRETADPAADVLSLGTTLARLLTLESPHSPAKRTRLWTDRLNAEPISAGHRRRLTTLLARMLAEAPEDRPDWATIYHHISALAGEPASDSIASFCRNHVHPAPDHPVEDDLRGSFWAAAPSPPSTRPAARASPARVASVS
jgi:serine/threonine protein kinase